MQAQQVKYDPDQDRIEIDADKPSESWPEVCQRFYDDVQRLRDADEQAPYTALYVCHDDDDQPVHFLVEEDADLFRLRHKVQLKKLGRTMK